MAGTTRSSHRSSQGLANRHRLGWRERREGRPYQAAVPSRVRLGSAGSHHEVTAAVTTPQVAAILVDGKCRVPTVALPGLPRGLRAARILIPVEEPARRLPGRRLPRHPAGPSLVALDGSGHPITPGAPSYVRQATVRSWRYPNPSAQGHCRPLDAEILLDAAHPGARPAAIPDWKPVPGAPRFFSEGGLTARRSGNARLIARQGSGLAQRMLLLPHLTATVRL